MRNLFDTLLEYNSIYLSSRPGMGDTTLIVNLADAYFRSDAQKNIAIFAYNFESSRGITVSDSFGARFMARESDTELYDLIRFAKTEAFEGKRVPQNDWIVYF